MGKKQSKKQNNAGTKRKMENDDSIYYGYSSEEDAEGEKSHSRGIENLRHSKKNKKKEEGSSNSVAS